MRATLNRRGLLSALPTLAFGAHAAPAPLRLSGEPLPPFTFEKDGRPAGLHWSMCEQVMAQLGHPVRWVLMPWMRSLRDMETGHLDGVIGTPRGHLLERERLMAFPEEPLSHVRSHFVSLSRQPLHFDGLFMLRGKTIAILGGYAHRPDFMAAPYFKRQLASSHEQCLRMLLAGRVDAALVDLAAARYFAHAEGLGERLHIDPHPYGKGRLYLGLSRERGHEALAMRFGEALRAFKRRADYRNLLEQYGLRGEDVEPLA